MRHGTPKTSGNQSGATVERHDREHITRQQAREPIQECLETLVPIGDLQLIAVRDLKYRRSGNPDRRPLSGLIDDAVEDLAFGVELRGESGVP